VQPGVREKKGPHPGEQHRGSELDRRAEREVVHGVPVPRAEATLGLLELVEHPLAELVQELALLRELQPPATPLDEIASDALAQLAHGVAHRGRGDVQP